MYQLPCLLRPNSVNPYSEAPLLIIVGSIFVAIMLLFVSVRIYTKTKIVGKSSPDDCTSAPIFALGENSSL